MHESAGKAYGEKSEHYFANVRDDIAPLLPHHAARVLELGCGNGATLKWLKAVGRCDLTCGIELFADAAAAAQTGEHRVDQLLQGDVEQLELPWEPGSFDLILCLDVLEHLVDPWTVARRLTALLKPGGRLIAAIPNVRNWHALLPLLFAGRWRYTDAGILDRTHLRFFTRESAVALVAGSGVTPVAVLRLPLSRPSKGRWANRLTLGLLREFLTLQYLIAGDKPL